VQLGELIENGRLFRIHLRDPLEQNCALFVAALERQQSVHTQDRLHQPRAYVEKPVQVSERLLPVLYLVQQYITDPSQDARMPVSVE
jgi:hypothetical protein